MTVHDQTPQPAAGGQTVWQWEGAEPYKNDVLRLYQQKLRARGITNTRIFVAQIVQENGAMAANVIGDKGCSIGIPQYNACSKHHVSAKRWIELHPEWATADHQLEWLADQVEWRTRDLKTEWSQIVNHNCPLCVTIQPGQVKGGKTYAEWKAIGNKYYNAVSSRKKLLISI